MSQVEWYYARDNQQAGPVSAVELKQLAAAGDLSPDDLVWREGMAEWAPARNVRGLFEAAPAPAATPTEPAETHAATPAEPAAPSPAFAVPAAPRRHPFDVLFDKFRPVFNAGLVDSIGRFFRACGSYGLLAAVLLTVIFSAMMAWKEDPLANILFGIAILAALVSLQYLADKFCDALDRLNTATPGGLPSSVFPDGLAVLSKLLGIVILLASIFAAVQTSVYALILLGVAAFLTLAYLSLMAMNPAALNYSIGGECGAAEEALAVFMYLFKALTRFVPVAFGVGVVCGALLLGVSCFLIVSGEFDASTIGDTSSLACRMLIFSALLPPIAYVFFLLCYLLHGICRAVLSIPSSEELDRRFADGEGIAAWSEQRAEK